MLEIMMYLWITVWHAVVYDLPHGQVDGQQIQQMAHTNGSANSGKANSNNPNR